MPGHLRAADAPEDLWRCHECGWTYPNHHPSAKHRRHHKMQCGKIPGFMKVTEDLKLGPQVVATGSSSDDGSSDEDHHPLSLQARKNSDHHRLELPQSASNIEQVCSNKTDLTPSKDGGAQTSVEISGETTLTAKGLDFPTSKGQIAGLPQVSDQGHRRIGSAHAVKGQWNCRHCGWLYPNAHPSAKSRRKHKKICGVVAEHSIPGGSSDEASSSDEEKHCGNESNGLAQTQEHIQPTEEQAPCAFGTSDANDGPLLGETSNRSVVVPGELKRSELDGAVTSQQPLEVVSTERVENRKPDESLAQQVFSLLKDHKSINEEKKEESNSSVSEAPIILGTDSVAVSPKSKAAKGVSVGGESPCGFEVRTPTQSPEGLVRSRVEIFEKLAGTSPQYLSPKKTLVSPTVGSGSPVTHLHSNGGWAHPASKQDGPSELQEVMSHVLHRGNFAQIDYNQVPVEST